MIGPRWDIIEEHLAEAAFLYGQWEKALVDPEYVLAEVAEGPEERMLAHLDGLVVAGRRAAEKLLLPALAGDDPEVVFAAAWALLMSDDGDFSGQVLAALAEAQPVNAAAIGRALQISPRAGPLETLPSLVSGGSPAAQAAVTGVLAHRRIDPGMSLEPLLISEDPGVRKAALRLARHFPSRAYPESLERALQAADPEERDLAMVAGLIAGLQPAWTACRQVNGGGGPAWDVPAILYALSGEPDLEPLVAGLQDNARRRSALFALGFTGRVEAAEAVLPYLADPKEGKVAGEAFSAVTGLVISGKMATPPERWDPDAPEEEEEGAGEDLEEDPADALPAPNPAAVEAWWAEGKKALAAGGRLLAGKPWSQAGLLEALEHAPMRRREALALDLAIRTRGQVQLAWNGTTAEQRSQLAQARLAVAKVSARTYNGA